MLYIILGGLIVSNLKGEYTLELLTVAEPEGQSAPKGKGKKRKGGKDDQARRDFIFWLISWMPEKWINRILSNADEDDDIG